jgi:hypothetical protein
MKHTAISRTIGNTVPAYTKYVGRNVKRDIGDALGVKGKFIGKRAAKLHIARDVRDLAKIRKGKPIRVR